MISPISIGNGGSRERNNSTEIPECVSLWTKKVIISHLHLRDICTISVDTYFEVEIVIKDSWIEIFMSDKMDFAWQTFDEILNKWILIVLEVHVYRYNQVNGGIEFWLFEEYLWYMNND